MYTSGRYKFTYAKKDGYDTTAVRQNGDVRMLRLENAFFGKIPKGEWKAKAYLYNSERGYPGAAVREEPGKFRHQDRSGIPICLCKALFKTILSLGTVC